MTIESAPGYGTRICFSLPENAMQAKGNTIHENPGWVTKSPCLLIAFGNALYVLQI